MIKILLADDQPLVRTGFRMILDAEPDMEVIAEAGDGADAVRQARQLRPDVVVMDIRMPVQDGIAATAEIAAAGHARVLVLTTFHVDEHVVGALRAGASGFLLKDTQADRLLEAIRVVHAGDAIVDPAVTRKLLRLEVRLLGLEVVDELGDVRPVIGAAEDALQEGHSGILPGPHVGVRPAALTPTCGEPWPGVRRSG